MSENKNRTIIPGRSGLFTDLAARLKLILRLMGDSRVSPLLKLLPIGSILYFVIPDLAIGPIDDVAIVWLGSYLFVELCPPDVVQEHMERLKQEALVGGAGEIFPSPEQPTDASSRDEDVIEGEYREKL